MSRHAIARIADVVVQEVGDELAVFDGLTQRSHVLDALSAQVWRASDGERDADAVAALVGRKTEQVEAAWVALAEAGLVVLPEGLSRRSLLAKSALVGGAAL